MDLENLCGCGENDCPDCAPAEIRRQDARIAALEAALAAAREENERLLSEGEFSRRAQASLSQEVGLHYIVAWPELVGRVLDELKQLAALRASREDEGRVERVREPVRWFAERMERKLKENDHKSHWSGCDPVWLFERLEEEATELRAAFRPTRPVGCFADTPKDAERIIDEAADVANFAMMIADNARAVLAAADNEGGEK